MNQMIAADGERIAVTGDHKDRHIFPRRCDAGSDRGGTAVDRVHAVGVHVVRETRRAADTGNDHGVLALDPELGHKALERCKHRIVTTARAPAHLLITGKILTVQWLQGQWYAGKSSIARAVGAERGSRHV